MPKVSPPDHRVRRRARGLAAVTAGLGLIAAGGGLMAVLGSSAAATAPEPAVAVKLRQLEPAAPPPPAQEQLEVVQGRMGGSLYASVVAAGAPPEVTTQLGRLFAHKLDFSRDIRRGDEFRLVFERPVAIGQSIDAGALLFAEIAARGEVRRFYRYEGPGAEKAAYFDEQGRGTRGLLLATPVERARVSSPFGMRRHPILGFDRMHQGVDFAAAWGSPVAAGGDGVVVEAGRNGGYGNWVKVRHTGGWETGYAHLAGYGPGVRPGRRVMQGQVIGYVGSTGSSTGPHLHYEVWKNGVRLDPRAAGAPQGAPLNGRALELFVAQRAAIDRLVANAPGAAQTPRLALADLQRRS